MLFDSPIPLAEQKANRMNEPTGRSLGWEIAQRDCRERNRQKVSGRWAPTRWMPACTLLSPALCSPLPPVSGWVS